MREGLYRVRGFLVPAAIAVMTTAGAVRGEARTPPVAAMAFSAPASTAIVAVIDHDRLRPAELTAAVMQPVVFVNRSQRPVDVEFTRAAGKKHVLRLDGSAQAVSFSPGRHPFVVRFADEPRQHLHGVVMVSSAPGDPARPPICGRVPPSSLCIER